MTSKPHFGHTKSGLAVHARTVDHHPAGSLYQRFNRAVALFLVNNVGTMTCFWVFNLIALGSLPATLKLAGVVTLAWVPTFFLTFGWIYLISWIAQSYVQLVLLPALMVGQNLQNEAADARAAKTFEDVEAVRADLTKALDALDTQTRGGLAEVLDAVHALSEHRDVAAQITVTAAPDPEVGAAIQKHLLAYKRANGGRL